MVSFLFEKFDQQHNQILELQENLTISQEFTRDFMFQTEDAQDRLSFLTKECNNFKMQYNQLLSYLSFNFPAFSSKENTFSEIVFYLGGIIDDLKNEISVLIDVKMML